MLLELTDDDFNAYGEGRIRPRGDVKRRLLAWARAVVERLAGEGIDLDVVATDEHPGTRNGHRVDAQSVFMVRGAAARKAMRLALGSAAPKEDEGRPELGHARVELRVDAAGVSLSLWIGADARIDLESAVAVLESASADEAWAALPAGASVDARPTLSARARASLDLSPADAATMAKGALDSEVPLVIGFRVPRARAVQPLALGDFFEHALSLGRFWAALVWSPEHAARPRAPRERPSRRGRRPRLDPIDRGARVRALAGPFAGQSGVVQELDGKGGARVLFGLLAARVELRDLTVANAKRGRALLSSSHRKPSS